MSPDQTIIHQTRAWLREVVIGCNFCPFAAKPYNQGRIHFEVFHAANMEPCLEALIRECRRLDADVTIETTLLILPDGFSDFEEYLDLVALAEDLLVEMNYEGTYQVASFHPAYRFADSTEDDPANYTNRSLYPMLHLLREASVERAIVHYPDPEGIPERNVDYARQRGLAHMQLLREACFAEQS